MRKSSILIFFGLFLILQINCKSDPFTELTEEEIDKNTFRNDYSAIDVFINEGYSKEKIGGIVLINDSTGTKQVMVNHIGLIRFIDDKYIGLISGLPTIDAGWKYLIIPTYSDLTILNREDLSVQFEKRIYDRVSDLSLRNDSLFFEYGKYPNIKYGYFILD